MVSPEDKVRGYSGDCSKVLLYIKVYEIVNSRSPTIQEIKAFATSLGNECIMP